MRAADLEAGKTVERALKNQVRQRDGCLERVADRVGEEAVAGEPARRLQLAGAQRVHEDEHTQFLALRPKRVEFRVGEILAGTRAADANAAQAEVFHRVLDLLRGEIGILQRGRREGDETVRVAGAELRQRLVVDADQFGGGIALGPVPVGVDAERLHIDAGPVHLRQPFAEIRPQEGRRFERVIDHLRGVRDDAMGVHVDGLDALARDHDLPAAVRMGVPARAAAPTGPWGGAGPGADAGRELAAGKDDSSPCAGTSAGKMVPADRHLAPPNPKHHRQSPGGASLHRVAGGIPCLRSRQPADRIGAANSSGRVVTISLLGQLVAIMLALNLWQAQSDGVVGSDTLMRFGLFSLGARRPGTHRVTGGVMTASDGEHQDEVAVQLKRCAGLLADRAARQVKRA